MNHILKFNETSAYEYCNCKNPKPIKKYGRNQEHCNICGKPFKERKTNENLTQDQVRELKNKFAETKNKIYELNDLAIELSNQLEGLEHKQMYEFYSKIHDIVNIIDSLYI